MFVFYRCVLYLQKSQMCLSLSDNKICLTQIFFCKRHFLKNIVRGKLDAPYALLTVVIENNLVTNMKIISIKKSTIQ